MAHGMQYIPRSNPPKVEPPKAEVIAAWLRHTPGCTCTDCLRSIGFLDAMAEDFNEMAWKQWIARARVANKLNSLS